MIFIDDIFLIADLNTNNMRMAEIEKQTRAHYREALLASIAARFPQHPYTPPKVLATQDQQTKEVTILQPDFNKASHKEGN